MQIRKFLYKKKSWCYYSKAGTKPENYYDYEH